MNLPERDQRTRSGEPHSGQRWGGGPSGAMPVAQFHYPFENDTIMEDGRFPADFICEAVDQTRGWFYSLLAISTISG